MNNDLQQTIHRAACRARSRYRCATGRVVSAVQRGRMSEARAWAAIAKAERSLQKEYARLVRQASELPIHHRLVENIDGIRRVPRVLPGAWTGENPARWALLHAARQIVEMVNAALPSADANICLYDQGFLVVEGLLDGEVRALALAHDPWRLAWL